MKNLQNIRRPSAGPNSTMRSPRADEDLQVMQEAAENRRQRGFRLPTWANRALSEEASRALPARDTVQSIEHRRSGSRDMATNRWGSWFGRLEIWKEMGTLWDFGEKLREWNMKRHKENAWENLIAGVFEVVFSMIPHWKWRETSSQSLTSWDAY